MYAIYKITSPAGKSYVGLTKNAINDRWRQHVKRAFSEKRNHPFYNAIRKYGPAEFTVEHIGSAPDKSSAQRLEVQEIALQPTGTSYNLSSGGEADGEKGAEIFWKRMASDPEAKAAYLRKLSVVKKQSDWTNYSNLSDLAAKWRRENPKQAYRMSLRALRIAGRRKTETPNTRSLKERLMWKHKRSFKTRENSFALWARRTQQERKEVGAKISAKALKRWSEVESAEARAALTASARAAICRKKQGAAASKGLSSFWVELKKDPEKYREYMVRRTQSLMKTLESKQS